MSELPQPSILGEPIAFYRLGPDSFEHLSRDLIREQSFVNRAYKYGTRGYKQRGIDVYSTTKDGNGIVVGQAKAYEEVTKADIKTATDKFFEHLDYWKDRGAKYFILIYGSSVTDIKAEERIQKEIERFRAEGIKFDVWDSDEIVRIISLSKLCATIFKKYFLIGADEYVKTYCNRTVVRKKVQAPKRYVINDHIERVVTKWKSNDGVDSQNVIETYDLYDVIQEESRVLLLADAGIGKTHEMKYLTNRINSETRFTAVFISLRNYTDRDIEYYLTGEQKEHHEELIILLDGLDEIKPEYRGTFLRRIEEFSISSLSRIVISCRTNHFEGIQISQGSEMSGFQNYYLNKLDSNQREDFLNKLDEGITKNLTKLIGYDFKELLLSPFYLKQLARVYKEKKRLPSSSKVLFNYLIKSKVDKFYEKNSYDLIGFDKDELLNIVYDVATKFALSIELTGKNSCDKGDALEILTAKELNLMLDSGILIEDIETESFSFEHRQIQEFLAALKLSSQDLETIKSFISVPPVYDTVLPSWFNTVGMLLTLISEDSDVYSKLISYLIENNSEVFIYVEQDRLSEELSLNVFKAMIHGAKRKGIGISISFYELNKLTKLTEYRAVQEYLISEIKGEWNDGRLIVDLLTIAEYTSFHNKKWREELITYLYSKILDDKTKEVFIWKSIYTISGLGLTDKEKIDHIIKVLGHNESESIRSSIYKLIEESNHQGTFSDFIFGQLRNYVEDKTKKLLSSNQSILLDVPFNLSSLILKIDDPIVFSSYIEFISEHIKIIEELTHDFLKNLVQRGNQFNSNEDAVFKAFIQLYIGYSNTHLTGWNSEIASYFINSNTKTKALKSLLDQEDKFRRLSPWLLNPFINVSNFEVLIEYFGSKKISKKYVVVGLLQNIKEKFSEDHYEYLKSKLEDLREEKLVPEEPINWEKKRLEKSDRTIEIIFSKEEFINEIGKVFSLIQGIEKVELQKRDIWLEAHKRNDLIISDTVLDYVGEYFDRDVYDKNAIIESLENRDWKDWAPRKFYDIYVHGELKEEKIDQIRKLVNEDQKEVILNWCYNQVPNYDFKKSMEVKEDGYSSILINPILIWMYQRIFQINFDNKIIKDMISFDYYNLDSRELNYYEDYISVREIITEVISNLEEGIRDTFVVKKHLKYLSDKDNPQLQYFLEKYLTAKESNDVLKSYCLELLLKNKSGIDIVLNNLNNYSSEFYWKIIDRVTNIERLQAIEQDLLMKLKDEDEKVRLNASVRLMRFSNLSGLKYYISKVKEIKAYPEYEYMYTGTHVDSPISLYENIDGLPVLLDFLMLEYDKNFTTDNFNRVANAVVGSLKKMSVKSYSNFESVYTRLETFINENAQKNERVKNLYWSLESISKEYYLNYSRSISLREAVQRVNSLM